MVPNIMIYSLFVQPISPALLLGLPPENRLKCSSKFIFQLQYFRLSCYMTLHSMFPFLGC